jgi:hypothetical protein
VHRPERPARNVPEGDGSYSLTSGQIADVNRIREDLRAGRTRLASDHEVAALWKQCGL